MHPCFLLNNIDCKVIALSNTFKYAFKLIIYIVNVYYLRYKGALNHKTKVFKVRNRISRFVSRTIAVDRFDVLQ